MMRPRGVVSKKSIAVAATLEKDSWWIFFEA